MQSNHEEKVEATSHGQRQGTLNVSIQLTSDVYVEIFCWLFLFQKNVEFL